MDSEVTVVGAGVVGSSLACLLSSNGIQVTLIDRGNPFSDLNEINQSFRTVALNLSSVDLFKKIGLWDDLKSSSTPFARMFVWDSEGSSSLEFLAQEINRQELGYVITNNLILKNIQGFIKKSENITFKHNTELSGLELNENTICVSCNNGEKFFSKLLVGADGVNSTLRNLSGIKTRTWSYNQKAFVAGLKTEKPHEQSAWQIFTPTGPIALLPFDNYKDINISLVWSAEDSYAKKLSKLTKKGFIKELEIKTERILGKISLNTEINDFPLVQLHSKSYFSERMVLVGDAAHSFHPLAGQGMNLGLSDVDSLFTKIINARRSGIDIGLNQILKDYESSRKIPNLTMTALMEVFKRGFDTPNPWIGLARNLAFKATSDSKILKRKFIKEAAGIT